MSNGTTTDTEIVESAWIDGSLLFSGDTSVILSNISAIESRYSVKLNMRWSRGCTEVRVTGQRRFVFECLMREWATNGQSDEEMRLQVEGWLGDKLADHMWNTGCRLGLPGHAAAINSPEFVNDLRERGVDVRRDDPSDLVWERHWADARAKTGDNHGGERDTEVAINLLAATGRTPNVTDNDYDPVVTAQAYLELAFAHVPELMDTIEALHSASVPDDDDVSLDTAYHAKVMEDCMRAAMKAGDLMKARAYLGAWQSLYESLN